LTKTGQNNIFVEEKYRRRTNFSYPRDVPTPRREWGFIKGGIGVGKTWAATGGLPSIPSKIRKRRVNRRG